MNIGSTQRFKKQQLHTDGGWQWLQSLHEAAAVVVVSRVIHSVGSVAADEGEEEGSVVAGRLGVDGVGERALVHPVILRLDVLHVDLGPGDDDPDERRVRGAQPFHGLVQHPGEVPGGAVGAPEHGEEAEAEVTRRLALDGALQGPVVHVVVRARHRRHVRPAPLAEDADEGALVRAQPPLAGLVEVARVQRHRRRVHHHRAALGARDGQVREQEPLVVAGGPLRHVVLEVAAEPGAVRVPHHRQLRRRPRADHLRGGAQVGDVARQGLLQDGGVARRRVQDPQQHGALVVAAELRRETAGEVLVEHGAVLLGDRRALRRVAVRQDADHRRAVAAEPAERLVEVDRVLPWPRRHRRHRQARHQAAGRCWCLVARALPHAAGEAQEAVSGGEWSDDDDDDDPSSSRTGILKRAGGRERCREGEIPATMVAVGWTTASDRRGRWAPTPLSRYQSPIGWDAGRKY